LTGSPIVRADESSIGHSAGTRRRLGRASPRRAGLGGHGGETTPPTISLLCKLPAKSTKLPAKILAEIPDLFGPGLGAQMTYYETDEGAKGLRGRRLLLQPSHPSRQRVLPHRREPVGPTRED
jgi:hypothetical protein